MQRSMCVGEMLRPKVPHRLTTSHDDRVAETWRACIVDECTECKRGVDIQNNKTLTVLRPRCLLAAHALMDLALQRSRNQITPHSLFSELIGCFQGRLTDMSWATIHRKRPEISASRHLHQPIAVAGRNMDYIQVTAHIAGCLHPLH